MVSGKGRADVGDAFSALRLFLKYSTVSQFPNPMSDGIKVCTVTLPFVQSYFRASLYMESEATKLRLLLSNPDINMSLHRD